VPTVVWRCNHPEEEVARTAMWIPADRASAFSGAAGTILVAYPPLYAWGEEGEGGYTYINIYTNMCVCVCVY
jgi:hypothetical protein